mmetsp:Transcript_18593/g.29465  ORF Transcript_18593/g.29465 Transcript_18593/m.29465 type:complete len:300 (+) Transcript_18593:152-1051(+)
MNFYKNQEIQVLAKFVGVADDGKIQVKVRGVHNVVLSVEPEYIVSGGDAPTHRKKESAIKKRDSAVKKKKVKTALQQEADDAWGASDEEDGGDAKKPEKTIQEADNEDEEPEDAAASSSGGGAASLKDASQISIGDERFHPKQHFKSMVVEGGGSVLKTTESKSVMCGFGTVECDEAGKTYHWKVQIVQGKDVNLGVIWTEHCKKNKKEMWWLGDEGYSYWGDDGQIYHSDKYKKYGATYGEGDVIDIWLNLKKYNISFAKNGEKYGKAFKVDKTHAYRFGCGVAGHPHVLQMLEFSVE